MVEEDELEVGWEDLMVADEVLIVDVLETGMKWGIDDDGVEEGNSIHYTPSHLRIALQLDSPC